MSWQSDDEICNRSSTLDTEESSFYSDGQELQTSTVQKDKKVSNHSSDLDSEELGIKSDRKEPPFNIKGVIMSIYTYAIFHYCLVVQETITTPMVMKKYNWSLTQINLLFAGAGFVSLVTSLSVRYLSRRIRDPNLLIASVVIGLLGSILQMDIPWIEKVLPIGRFVLGFMLSYMAYSIGRNVVLGLFSNILGSSSQGKWMGVITAAGAIARSLAPFLAWQAMEVVQWKTWLEFGLCALFFLISLVGTIVTFDILVPYSEFAAKHTLLDHDGAGSYHLHATSTAYSRQKSSLTEPLI